MPHSPRTTDSESHIQDDVWHRLRAELNGAVLHDPALVDKHSCNDDQLNRFLDACHLFDPDKETWKNIPGSGHEMQLYPPIVEVLNAIGQAVHLVCLTEGLVERDYVPFLDKNNRKLRSDYLGMNVAPDIIKCEIIRDDNLNLHWRDVDLFVEVKTKKSQVTEAIQQSARYVRALLAHRIDRRFVKTMVICETTVVFLHFDRSGLVYSNDIEMYDDARVFARALAGLLLLSRVEAGYNPIFEGIGEHPFGWPEKLRLHVGTDVLAYRIVNILCHRLSIRGRATLVLALRRILDNLDPDATASDSETVDAVLKLLWRNPNRFQEGLILKQFVGTYGVCQILADVDIMINGKVDEVYPRTSPSPGPRGDVFGELDEGVDVTGALRDDGRILSAVLMQPGRPLKLAGSVDELKAAFVGAIMGHWALVNVHVQHRDISIHNILLPLRTQQYDSPEWDLAPKLDGETYAPEFQAPEWIEIFRDLHGSYSKRDERPRWKFDPKRRFSMLRRIIELLGPAPRGFLSDVDHANILSLKREGVSDLHTHRTGTPAFMATNLLLAAPGAQLPHTYLHDLESFFWVLLYVVAEHQEEGTQLHPNAQRLISELNTIDYRTLGKIKNSTLLEICEGTQDVRSFATSWVKSPRFDATSDPDACFEQDLNLFLSSLPQAQQDIRISGSESRVRPTAMTTLVIGEQRDCVCAAACHHITASQ